MKKSLLTKRAFTLLELIIVISCMAIILAAGVVSYASFNRQALDGRRKQDLVTLRSALEVYKTATGCYPATLAPLEPNYLSKTLTDPKTNAAYPYSVSGCADYTLRATLADGTVLLMNPYGAK